MKHSFALIAVFNTCCSTVISKSTQYRQMRGSRRLQISDDCLIIACTADFSPVCGSDGETYSNTCFLEMERCKHPNLKMVQVGECVACPEICPYNYEPVCGSNGETYSNKCFLEIEQCKHPSLKMVQEGICDSTKVKPTMMTSSNPSSVPSLIPTKVFTSKPTMMTSSNPSLVPSLDPTKVLTLKPKMTPPPTSSSVPSLVPTKVLTSKPTMMNSSNPSFVPSLDPTKVLTSTPTMLTSSNPTGNIEKSCRDDDLLFFDNNKELTCLYLKESLQSKKDFWCSRPLAKYFCPATCNACK